MSRYRISTRARADIKQICRYVARDKHSAAGTLRSLFHEKFSLLASQPHMGQDRSDILAGLRTISAGSYVIYFIPLAGGVEIVRVLHGAREEGGALG